VNWAPISPPALVEASGNVTFSPFPGATMHAGFVSTGQTDNSGNVTLYACRRLTTGPTSSPSMPSVARPSNSR
jgi:hypothetical protein